MNLLLLLLGSGLGYMAFRPKKKDIVVVTDDEGVAQGLAGVTSIEIDGAEAMDIASAESEGVPDKIFGGTESVFGDGGVQTGTSTTTKTPRPPVSTLGGGVSSPVKRPTGKPAPTSTAISKLQATQSRSNIRANPKIKGDTGTTFGTITREKAKKGFDGMFTDFDGVEDKNYGNRTEFDGVDY